MKLTLSLTFPRFSLKTRAFVAIIKTSSLDFLTGNKDSTVEMLGSAMTLFRVILGPVNSAEAA